MMLLYFHLRCIFKGRLSSRSFAARKFWYSIRWLVI